jgi:diaminopimelate decarboxylase
LRKINTWKEKLPWIRPFYAIKSNPVEPLVKDVLENGAGFDVAS